MVASGIQPTLIRQPAVQPNGKYQSQPAVVTISVAIRIWDQVIPLIRETLTITYKKM